jgi:hypothetical protein
VRLISSITPEVWAKIQELVNEFDYLDVIWMTPHDEYTLEIQKIIDLLPRVFDKSKLAKGIQNIFCDTCGESMNYNNRTFEDFLFLAEKILRVYKSS